MAIVGRTPTLAENASATSITGTLPTDRQAGDITIVSFHMGTTVANFTGPGGSWVQAVAPTANAANEIVAVYYQFDPGSAPVGSTSGAATRQTAICQSYGGVDPNNPIDVAAAITTAAGTPLNVAGITTVTNGARLVCGATVDATTGTWTIPATMTLVKQHTAGTGRGGAVADETFTTAGPTGTRTWQWSGAGLAMVGYLAALRPAPDSTAPPPKLPPHLLLQIAARFQQQWTTGLATAGPVDLDGTANAAASASADLAVDRPLDGTGSAAASATATLSITRDFAASSPAAASAGATATIARGLTATGPAAASATGSLDVARPLTAIASAAASASAALAVDRPISATAPAAASGTGDLSIQGQVALTAVAPTAASAAGALIRTAGLTGMAAAAATAAGTASVVRPLTGVSAAAAAATADLAILAPYVPALVGVDSSTTAGTLDSATRSSGVDSSARSGTLDHRTLQPAAVEATTTATHVDP